MLPVIEFVADLSELATELDVHAFAVHITELNTPGEPGAQVTAPPPEYPATQITVTDWPVVPVMEPDDV